jgi:hypothetical protein
MLPNAPNLTFQLINIEIVKNEIGNSIKSVKSTKTVIGSYLSITNYEFYGSLAEGKEISKAIKINALAYQNEKYALIKDEIYKIERIYYIGQFMEVYLSYAFDINDIKFIS